MATYSWTSGEQQGGCPGADKYIAPGWYLQGQKLPGATPLATTYKNPATGAAWTPQELGALGGGATPTGTTTPAPTTPTTEANLGSQAYTSLAGIENPTQEQLNAAGFGKKPLPTTAPPAGHPAWTDPQYAGMLAGLKPGDPIAGGATMPTFGAGAAAGIPTPTITPAPAYEISPAQTAFEEMLGGKVTDWVEAGGYGIPEETQALMIQKQTDSLKARETENIRVMRNNMERRGITNSGFIFSNEQAIRSNTTVAIAGAIADVQINSALMKMASFEKAMGAAGQFLGYLSEQSQLKYAPKFATWQAEQLAKMQVWQGKLDVYKMELNQAYQTQNINLQGYWNQKLQDDSQAFELQITEMTLEAQKAAAQAQGAGQLFGASIGAVATIAAA